MRSRLHHGWCRQQARTQAMTAALRPDRSIGAPAKAASLIGSPIQNGGSACRGTDGIVRCGGSVVRWGAGSVRGMHVVGLVLHPRRDSAEAVDAVMGWAARRQIAVVGLEAEISRLNCAAIPVTAEELGRRSDLLVSLGGDGTMLRAMRLADL